MMILTAVEIMFISVSANHLGLIGKIEEISGYSLPIVNCPKCLTFWLTLFCTIRYGIIQSLAVSFAFAYLALWTELAMCMVDSLYKMIYEKFISDSATDTASADSHIDDADSAVPHMRKK